MSSLDKAIRRVPQWAGAQDLRTTFISGGITNLNYRVDMGGESYVLRIGGADSGLLGIQRECEYAANRAAASVGIAPEVVYFMQPEGWLVTRFISGRPLSPEEIGQPANIRRVAEALRRIHALPPIPLTFSPFRTVEEYTATARSYGVAFPDNFDRLAARTNEIESAFRQDPFVPHLCHNDLLNANFLDDGRLYILDWEYAGMGDVIFDLANFAAHHEFKDEQDRFLLECYFGDPPTPAGLARLNLMKIASDFREAMWGMVQIGISKIDFDFRGYAEKHFGRMVEALGDPHYERWLKDASENNS